MIAVLAGTRGEFLNYAKGHPTPRPVFCDRPERIVGMEFSGVAVVGTFFERPDARELADMVDPRVRPRGWDAL